MSIKVVQSFLPYRYFGLGDAVANAIGAVLSLAWFAVEPTLEFVRVKELADEF